MISKQQQPGCSDCEPLGADLSVCTGECAPKAETQQADAPEKLWLSAPDDDNEHVVWFDPDEGGTEYVRSDIVEGNKADALAAEAELSLVRKDRARLTEANKALEAENERWEKRATTGDGVAGRLRAKLAKVEAERDTCAKAANLAAKIGWEHRDKADRLSAELAEARKVVELTNDAIAEYIRYLDGGEMRGSYDGKPERNGLRKAHYAARSFLSSEKKP